MAYTGFISDPSYCRKDEKTEITAQWTIKEEWSFEKTIRGTAMNAFWGDVAEYYKCDKNEVLIPGTVVSFGGKFEITKSKSNDKHIFGVISSKPGFILNNKEKNNSEPVAMVGRVPVRVIGKIKKFQFLTTSSVPGVAKKKTILDVLMLKPTIGRALEDKKTINEELVETFVHACV